jgi:8-oxo-dGTP pyrophosphatase MutT (NUDIX family)
MVVSGSESPVVEVTWDGRRIADDFPRGSMVVVYRRRAPALGRAPVEVLLLHRAHEGPEHEGDWAWTPPSGARQPGEDVLAGAVRELREEAGLVLPVTSVSSGVPEWAVWIALWDGSPVRLDADTDLLEHDRYIWTTPERALELVRPAVVTESLAMALRRIQ